MSTAQKIFDKLLAGKTLTLELEKQSDISSFLGTLRSIKSKQCTQMEVLGYSLTDEVIKHTALEQDGKHILTVWLGKPSNQRREFKILSETEGTSCHD